jgi:hypothetical protein
MLTKNRITLSAAIVIGSASAAFSGQDDRSDRGGFVHPPSMDGVNPAYHRGWFPNYTRGGSDYGFVPSTKYTRHSPR